MGLSTQPSPKEFGDALRRAREEAGVSLEQVVERTKITRRLLEAFESGDLGKLPGGVFPRLFLRQILAVYREDPEPWLRAFDAATGTAADEVVRSAALSQQVPARGHRPGPWIVGTLLVAVTLVGLVLLQRQRGTDTERVAVRPTAPTAASTEMPVEVPVQATATATPGSDAVAPADARVDAPAAVPTAVPAAAPEQTPAEPVPEGPGTLVLATGERPCWVEVRVEGQALKSRLMPPGGTWRIAAAGRPVELMAGDAGALSVSYLGRTHGPLGADGKVRRIRLPDGPGAASTSGAGPTAATPAPRR